MVRPVFGADHEAGKTGAAKRRYRKAYKREVLAAIRAQADPLTPARDRWSLELARIAIGAKHHMAAFRHISGYGCECRPPDDADPGAVCWLARTVSGMTVRVHDLVVVDYRIGPMYRVTLVRPDVWQLRAWVSGASHDREELEHDPDRWHQIAGLVAGPDLGARVD